MLFYIFHPVNPLVEIVVVGEIPVRVVLPGAPVAPCRRIGVQACPVSLCLSCQQIGKRLCAPCYQTEPAACLDILCQGSQPCARLCRSVVDGVLGIVPVRVVVCIGAPVSLPDSVPGSGSECVCRLDDHQLLAAECLCHGAEAAVREGVTDA